MYVCTWRCWYKGEVCYSCLTILMLDIQIHFTEFCCLFLLNIWHLPHKFPVFTSSYSITILPHPVSSYSFILQEGDGGLHLNNLQPCLHLQYLPSITDRSCRDDHAGDEFLINLRLILRSLTLSQYMSNALDIRRLYFLLKILFS